MDFEHGARTKSLIAQLQDFTDRHIYPDETVYDAQMEAFGAERWQARFMTLEAAYQMDKEGDKAA